MHDRKKKYNWNTHNVIREAVQYVVEGSSYHKAYKKTGVSPATIKKFYLLYRHQSSHLKKSKESPSSGPKNYEELVFTPEQEVTLMKYIKDFEYLFQGLTDKECRMLAYQMLIIEDMKIPDGWKHGMASIAWLVSFQLRQSSFIQNLRKPDRVCIRKIHRARMSLERTIIWEKKTVTIFYDDLEKCFQKNPELKNNNRIYSMDEAYTSINPEIKSVNRESRNDLLTICCFICADGTSFPPVIIKPHLPFDVCCDTPPGAVVLTGSHGRLTPDLFTEVMQHFVKHSHSSPSNPNILIMDTDLCHLSYAALTLAHESGVHLLTLHPHINILLQPLHGILFNSFYTYYYDAMEQWSIEQKDKTSVACDIGKFLREAYSKTMISENIQNGFKKCGISPFDRDLFTYIHYLSCLDDVEQTCIECRIRDGRSGRPSLEKSVDDDETITSSGKLQVEQSVKPTGDGGESSQSQGIGELKAVSDCAKIAKAQSSQELDKLKRRLIRSVARLIKEKKTEDEVWDELKKECGKNCRTLWLRMRSLTLKKLKRLLDADDRNEHVPAVARMTLTDWLLYDLVLVHEKIDVINRASNEDSKVLSNLFSLVQRFQIEGRAGDDLAEAWTAATVSYNSKGHQCSPMLMQRRWYQIKELTRHKLYQFWFNYRGNERLLVNAKQDPPTPLQRSISLRYPELITQQFPTWEERVEQKLVVMPEEFEVKMRKKDLMKPSDEKIPDVEIVEQKIDTITVDSDSDFNDIENDEESVQDTKVTENGETSQTPVIVKTEPEDPYDNIDITEHPVYPEKQKDRFQDAIERLEIEEDIIANHIIADDGTLQEDCVMPLITNVTGAVDETSITQNVSKENNAMQIDSEYPTQIVNTEQGIQHFTKTNTQLEGVINACGDNSQESIVIDVDDDEDRSNKDIAQNRSNTPVTNQFKSNLIDITSPEVKRPRNSNDIEASTAHNVYSTSIAGIKPDNNEVCPVITAIASGSPVKTKMEMNIDIKTNETVNENMSDEFQDTDDLIEDIIKVKPEKYSEINLDNEPMIETNLADEGFEFADDGIEYNEDHNDQRGFNETPEQDSKGNAGNPKFDLKLLMNPVVYTTKLDDMKVYASRSLFDTVDEKHLVDKIILESKPVSAKSINVEQIKADNHNTQEANDFVPVKVENLDEVDDDLFQNESSNDSIPLGMLHCHDSKRVKLSSSLLQKPRSRTYNPIQLCKNPDFNTRLKRLTVGFFSSTRNRVFLKACKPMTIDLSKAFESKLINGTMYLKPSDQIVHKEVDDVSESAASIVPSAVAVQSLMDTTDVDKILQGELRKRILERNKTITLPNLSVVRQINQQLLMAEVAPIVTQAENSACEELDVLNRTVKELDSIDSTETVAKKIASQLPPNPVKRTLHVQEITNQTPTNSVKQTAAVKINTTYNKILPMMNNNDKPLEKPRKKYERPNMNRPMWSTIMNNTDLRPQAESLLTIDTLYKVLNTLDPTSVHYRPKTKGSQNKIGHPRPGRPVSSSNNKPMTNLDNKNKITSQILSSINLPSIDLETSDPPTSDPPKSDLPTSDPPKSDPPTSDPPTTNPPTTNSPTTNPPTTDPPTSKKAKSNVPVLPKKQKNCCWARTRIIKIKLGSNAQDQKHKCPATYCRCCCKEILRQIEINHEIMLLEQMQNRDTCDETIERVVKQSRCSSNVTIQPVTQLSYPTKKKSTKKQPSRNISKLLMSSHAHVQHGGNMGNAHLTPQSTSNRINIGIQTNVDDQYTVTMNNASEEVPCKNIGINAGFTVPGKETEVTINLVDDDDNVCEIQSPKPKIRIHAAHPNVISHSGNETRVPRGNMTPPLLDPETPIPTVSKIKTKTAASPKVTATASTHSLEPDDFTGLPCTCRPNVILDKQSAMLVVDGSNQCPRHTKSRVSKETRIYLNRKHMSGTARPFFVGKNKILLTNVSRKVQPPPLPPPVLPSPLELPAGVQVALLSDGTISYLVDSGVTLTRAQIKMMPLVLAAIQQQIKASGVTLPENEPPAQENITLFSNSSEVSQAIDSTSDIQNNRNNSMNLNNASTKPNSMPDHKDSPNHDTVQTELQKEVIQEIVNEADNLSENPTGLQKPVDQEPSISDSRDIAVVKNTIEGEDHSLLKKTIVDKEKTVIDVADTECSKSYVVDPASATEHNTTESAEKNDPDDLNPASATEHNTSESAKKNCPDDLVQKSESQSMNNSAEKENSITVANSSRNLLSDLMEMSGILNEDVTPVEQQPTTSTESIQPLTIDTCQASLIQSDCMTAPLSPTAEKHSISAQINEKIYSLNPVTSFADLKYSCDNNGLFFKLDLNNGIIVPINVCIQKTPESSSAKNATPSEVIDLTEEQAITLEEPTSKANTQVNSISQPIASQKNHFKIPESANIMTQKIKIKDLSMMVQPPRSRGRPRKSSKSILIDNVYEVDEEEPSTSSIEVRNTSLHSTEEKKTALMKRLSNNLKPLKIHHDKRSSINILKRTSISSNSTPIQKRISNLKNMANIQVNLVDSDEPMEEEYLEDSSEDSDDEPLAKLAKRMRPDETDEKTDAQESQGVAQGNARDDDNVDFEDAIDAISAVEPPISSSNKLEEPVPTQLVLSGAALEQPLPAMMNNSLNFVANVTDDDDSDDDCILGV